MRRLFGEAEAIRLVKASEAVVDHIADFCRAHGIDAELRQDGTLYTATSQAQVGTLDPVMRALEDCGIHSYRALPPEEVARRSGSARNLAGVYSPIAATVHPGKLVRGLRRAALAMGIRIYERSPMLDFSTRPSGHRAHALRQHRGEEAGAGAECLDGEQPSRSSSAPLRSCRATW